ncbi:MAG: hypothetical protein M3680_25700 [Myxococcota bacterium]|nr:hypothetical protein [Myxococcota bacterium]
MPSRFACFALVVSTVSVIEAAPALASPEVRDHRPTAQPTVDTSVRHRRRPGPRFMMPLKIDLGAAGANTVRGFAPGVGAAVGIHWASLSPRPTDTDVGVGVFGALLVAPEDTAVMDDKPGVAYGGAYLEVGHTLSRGSFWRTWASGRGEYLASSAFGEDHVGFGATGRLSAELYVSGAGINPRGVFLGTYAIGLYVEAGVRDTVADVGSFHAGTGLTFRTPLVFAP